LFCFSVLKKIKIIFFLSGKKRKEKKKNPKKTQKKTLIA
jgi:hypothetical protein